MGKGGVKTHALRGSAGVRSGWLLAAGAVLSLLLHGVGGLVVLGPGFRERERSTTTVELVSKQDDRQREQRLEVRLPRRGDDGASRAGGSQSRRVSGGEKPFRLQDEADALKKPLHVAVDDEVLARTLKAVRRGIRPYWQDAEPPGMGKVALRMEIDGSGSIVSMWITKLQGPPKLGEFVASLVRRAAPFPGAGHGLPNPLVIDCAFNVTGRSANTAQ